MNGNDYLIPTDALSMARTYTRTVGKTVLFHLILDLRGAKINTASEAAHFYKGIIYTGPPTETFWTLKWIYSRYPATYQWINQKVAPTEERDAPSPEMTPEQQSFVQIWLRALNSTHCCPELKDEILVLFPLTTHLITHFLLYPINIPH